MWGAAAGERRGGRRGTSLSRLPESAYSSGGRIEAWRTLGRRETRLLVDCHHVPAVAPHKHGSGDALQQDLKILHVQVRGVAPARWRRQADEGEVRRVATLLSNIVSEMVNQLEIHNW